IFSCPLSTLSGRCLDIEPFATLGRYRFLSCRSICDEWFEVYETDELPEGRYCAVSYVWKGVRDLAQEGTLSQYFTVKGAEDGDPIGLHVLRDLAWAALQLKKDFIWLDRIGILQTQKEDKSWQIRNMFKIYQLSTCIILPGGVRRLVSITEETTWIDRAWTLQEALAP
ncbi:hypothetical protein BOTBODRAFT_91300, partial [Botryobasidium botryosum FD-172 SS1]